MGARRWCMAGGTALAEFVRQKLEKLREATLAVDFDSGLPSIFRLQAGLASHQTHVVDTIDLSFDDE
jgi:hypothetical protein